MTPKQILISIAFIWLIAIAAVIPYANALKYSGNNCTENWSVPENGKYYTLALFVMDYCVPLTIITYCYVRAGHVLHTKFKKLIVEKSTSAKQNLATTKRFKQNKKVIKVRTKFSRFCEHYASKVVRLYARDQRISGMNLTLVIIRNFVIMI